MRRYFLASFLLITVFTIAQVPSPEQFLGYKIGTRFTPHFRIVDYYKAVAAASPSTVKLQQYGTTNEGRPLLVAFVSSAGNLANLETIRTNNLAVVNKTGTYPAGQPAIVWLSYNVHGNEPSSSEAAMLTLYALVDPSNAQTKQYLQNTVAVLDPCINPDGRDRYVNWYNSVVGKTYDPSPIAREHNEPWPRGRANHYNFDLNRDWAWQTQKESQQRLAFYNQWLPQVHVDFHEQGYNQPYYFAPAAEPFHEVITKWQRDFQSTIGRNHAKYFDEKGWLYFTKERFDLLYPSYGDTYPLYNGAIGMTYEQGGIGAGLGVLLDNGDTLTLVDRAQHHFTTGVSTIEVVSKNVERLKKEFADYFTAANQGVGDYKAFVLKPGREDSARLSALLQLLDRNKIHYFYGRPGTARGLNYHTNKEESFAIGSTDIVVPSAQPKSNLLKVLFEPVTKLTDSATYDITAWALPYVYGVPTFAVKSAVALGQQVNGIDEGRKTANVSAGVDPYAYVIPWNGIPSVKLVGALLQKGIKLRFATTPFESSGRQFDRGSVIVLKTGNQYTANLWQMVRTLANENGVQLASVASGFVDKGLDFGSSSVLPVKARKVALLTGDGVSSLAAGEVWHYFEQVINYPVTLINATDAGRMTWSDYDVVIMPDGAYRFLTDKASGDAFKTWINNGGHVVALEGAVAQLSKLDWSLKTKKADDAEPKELADYIHRYEARERDALSGSTPGSIFRVQLDNTHPLAFGYPDYYYTLKQDAAIYDFIKEDGWNVGVLRKDKPVAGFVGTSLARRLQNGLLFGVQDIGRGSVTYLTDDVLFRSFWENGKLLFANAVFFVGQ
ncbi:M14 family metallopeptidase [Flavisolibacter nicotianae]|uniref:M14 family metallopeptidase n=1 Tax=Flavisolibacter nicotianae TaxID=2364882 RepID=UPI000EAD1076|nr:M14 family metallopeptidase [Flavisolibacter nicotianae]